MKVFGIFNFLQYLIILGITSDDEFCPFAKTELATVFECRDIFNTKGIMGDKITDFIGELLIGEETSSSRCFVIFKTELLSKLHLTFTIASADVFEFFTIYPTVDFRKRQLK